ncbi:polymer-forming cytoskeletal protein [Aeromonas veronii]|nr:polymer-forming cytoskeletal protein [Aeromonas veronii]MCD6617334.1 polymer-forming cytoskeletal protein [Aeromonas veronii]
MREMAGRLLARLQQRERSDPLYIVWLCWGAALLLYVLGAPCFLWPVAAMPLVLLVWLVERVRMFGRNKGGAATGSAGATVIAAGACFKGELQVEGELEVHGQINGTIQLIGGVLHIMQGGSVEGEVSAPHVIINGLLEGTCTSAEEDILESGKMQGIFKGAVSPSARAATLSVSPSPPWPARPIPCCKPCLKTVRPGASSRRARAM